MKLKKITLYVFFNIYDNFYYKCNFAFSFYFCFIHSFNHIKRILPSLRNNLSDKNIRNMFLFFTILTWVLGFLILTYLNYNSSLDHSIIKVTFIGLAALTFPHMILVDLLF